MPWPTRVITSDGVGKVMLICCGLAAAGAPKRRPAKASGFCRTVWLMPSLAMTRAIVAEAKAAPEWRTRGVEIHAVREPSAACQASSGGATADSVKQLQGTLPTSLLNGPRNKKKSVTGSSVCRCLIGVGGFDHFTFFGALR
jgi:hypothetical protein